MATGTSVFRSDQSFIYLNDAYCEFYIPMYYFDTSKRFAEDFGTRIKVLGVFDVGIFSNGKQTAMKTLNLPTMIDIFVYDSELREVTLRNGSTEQCKVVKYLKNAKIMQAMTFVNDEYAKKYLKLILSGNLPSIPYSKLLEVWLKNQILNDVNFGVSCMHLESILATCSRNPENLSEKFAKISNKEGVGEYDYTMSSIRQICQYNSTFTALTYEDIDSMITTSLNKARNKVKETPSPVEQIIKF